MKIGVLGNQNNNHSVLVRYLIDLGYDAKLALLNNEDKFYHPKSDMYDSGYELFTVHFNWGNYHEFLEVDKDKVFKDLSQFDFLIGVGTVPAFANRVGVKLDIMIACSGDISTYPFFWKLINLRRLKSVFKRILRKSNTANVGLPSKNKMMNPLRLAYNYYLFSKFQRKGVEETGCLLFDKTNDSYEKIIHKLRGKKDRITNAPPMLYTKMYNKDNFDKNLNVINHVNYQKILELRKKNDFLVLQYCRQLWLNAPDWVVCKGNDKLIYGFKEFIQKYPDVKSHLVLYNFGSDVTETKTLVKKLQLESYISWFEATSRKFVMPVISEVDVVVGELDNSWLTYGVVLETLCMKIPLMHKREDHLYSDNYNWLYPMIDAGSSEEVFNGLNKVFTDKNSLIAKGEMGYKWLQEFCVERALTEIIKRVEQKRAKRK